jgi:hypothetical protein
MIISSSSDPILMQYSLFESSQSDKHDGDDSTFLQAIGHVIFAFDDSGAINFKMLPYSQLSFLKYKCRNFSSLFSYII